LQLIFKNMVLVWGQYDKVGVPTSLTCLCLQRFYLLKKKSKLVLNKRKR